MIARSTTTKATGTRSGQRLVVAIPIVVTGEDVNGHPFTESTSTVAVNRSGGKLIISHEVAIESTVHITVPSRNKLSAARVVWLGEKTGSQQEIAVELQQPELFWGVQFPDDPVDWAAIAARRQAAQQQAAAAEAPPAVPPAPAPPPQPAAAAAPLSRPPVTTPAPAPASSRPPATPTAAVKAFESRELPAAEQPEAAQPFKAATAVAGIDMTGILNEMIASAVHQDLGAAVSGLRREVSQQIAEVQAAAVSVIQEQVQRAIAAQVERLEMRAIDVVTRNQQALESSVREFVENTQKDVEKKLRPLFDNAAEGTRNDVLEAVFSTKDRLQKEAAAALAAGSNSLRHGIQQEAAQLEKQFAEQCQSRAERMLSARIEEAGHTLSERTRLLDEDLTERLARRAEQTAGRFEIDVQRNFEKALDQCTDRLEKDLEQTAGRIRQSFMRQLVTELEQQKEILLQYAVRAREDMLEDLANAQQQFLKQVEDSVPSPGKGQARTGIEQEKLRRTQQALARLVEELGNALSEPHDEPHNPPGHSPKKRS